MWFSVTTELMVLVLMWIKTANVRKALSRENMSTPWSGLLLRDGMILDSNTVYISNLWPFRNNLLCVRLMATILVGETLTLLRRLSSILAILPSIPQV